MSVIVKCEKPKSHQSKKSCPRLMLCRPISVCPPPCPSPCPPPCARPCPSPCQPVVQIVPCRDTVVRCTMVQGGFLWNGVARLPCIVCPPSPPCCYVPCCPTYSPC